MDESLIISKRKRITVNVVFWVMMAFVLGWQIVTSFWGIDISDVSYYLANYRLFFNNVKTASFHMFLSNFFGGLFYRIFPTHQYLIFQLLGVLCFDAAMIATWRMFDRRMPKLLIPPCLFVGSLALTTLPTSLSYNSFSIVLLIPASALLAKALEKDKNIPHLIISGLTIGFSFFFRIPNVLFAGLVVVILWYDLACTAKYKRGLKDVGFFFLGGVSGTAIGYVLMKIFTASDTVSSSVKNLTAKFGDPNYGHSFAKIYKRIRGNFEDGFSDLKAGYLIGILAIIVCALLLIRIFKIKSRWFYAISAVAAAALTVRAEILREGDRSYVTWFNIFCIILYVFEIGFVIYFRKRNPYLSATSLICLFFAFAICIGTDNGMCENSLLAYLLITSVVCNAYTVISESESKPNKIKNHIIPVISIVLAAVMVCGTAWIFSKRSFTKKYREFEYRQLDAYSSAPAFYRVKTTADKASSLDTVYYFFRNPVLKNKKVLALGDFAAFYVATDCESFTGSVWPDLSADSILKGKFEEAVENGEYPIIVINKNNVSYFNGWKIGETSKIAMARKFAADHGYSTAVSTEQIDILVPLY